MDIVAYQPPAGDDMEARPVSDDAPPVKKARPAGDDMEARPGSVTSFEYEYNGRMVKSFEYEYQPPKKSTEARPMYLGLVCRMHLGLNKKPLKTIEEDKVYKSRRKPNAM